MNMKPALPVTTILGLILTAITVLVVVYMAVLALKPITDITPTQPNSDLTVLSDPVLTELKNYPTNAELPIRVDPHALSRDNPFAPN